MAQSLSWSDKLSVEYLRENLTWDPVDIINGLAAVSSTVMYTSWGDWLVGREHSSFQYPYSTHTVVTKELLLLLAVVYEVVDYFLTISLYHPVGVGLLIIHQSSQCVGSDWLIHPAKQSQHIGYVSWVLIFYVQLIA